MITDMHLLEEPHLYIPSECDIIEKRSCAAHQLRRYIFEKKNLKFTDYEITKIAKTRALVIKVLKKKKENKLLQSFNR